METAIDLYGAIEPLLYQQSGCWLLAGGAALLFYDWLLCLDREIPYICKARWTFGKILFVLHRYAMMVLTGVMVYGSVKSSTEDLSPERCRMWDDLSFISSIVITGAIQGTFALRVCVLYRDSVFIIALLGVIYSSCNAAMLFLYSKIRSSMRYLPNPYRPYHVCIRTCGECIRWSVYFIREIRSGFGEICGLDSVPSSIATPPCLTQP